MRPQEANGDAVILLHGVTDNRMGVYPIGKFLADHHYTVLMPDARHHGASGGLTTYGVREVDDIRRWLNWLENQEPARCVYGLGESMGGMELLESLPREPRFCGRRSDEIYSKLAARDEISAVARPMRERLRAF